MLTDKDTVAKVTLPHHLWLLPSPGSVPHGALLPPVPECPAARLRGVLLQPDLVYQPSGL